MLAKHGREFGGDWDLHLQQLLFAYRTKSHESNGEPPLYMLYGRDARLPIESTLETLPSLYVEDVETYCEELAEKSQKRQKLQYDKRADSCPCHEGGRVMVYMPAEDKGKKRKLALPYHGPFSGYWRCNQTHSWYVQ